MTRGVGGAAHPDGVIDFGDLSHTWAVSELAITVSSVLGHAGSDPTSILPGVRAFHAIRPLSADEAEVLWPLLVLRTAVLIVSGAQQAALDPDNAYVTEQTDGEIRMFEQATSIPIDVMTALIKADLGLAGEPGDVRCRHPAHRRPRSGQGGDARPVCAVRRVRLGVRARRMAPRRRRRANSPGEAVDDGAALVVTRFGQPRLSRATPLSQDSPDVVPTGISLWPAADTRTVAPWDGEVVDAGDDSVTLRGREHELTLSGVTRCLRLAPDSAPVIRSPTPRRTDGPKSACGLSVRHPRRS